MSLDLCVVDLRSRSIFPDKYFNILFSLNSCPSLPQIIAVYRRSQDSIARLAEKKKITHRIPQKNSNPLGYENRQINDDSQSRLC